MVTRAFSETELPTFEQAPSAILIVGDVEFFVEEAAARMAERLSEQGAEYLRFEDDAPVEAASDALLNRSLFSPRRIVQCDISRLLGTESPGRLLAQSVAAWERGTPAGKREAFRHARALLSALELSAAGPAEEVAEAATRKTRKKEQAPALAEILRELPDERGGTAVLASALRVVLSRPNDGTVALLTATAPPPGVDLVAEIARTGLVLQTSIGKDVDTALLRLARARAKQREVALDPDVIDRLRLQTDSRPELFAAELEKLLEWAGAGGRLRVEDVRDNVEDDSSEDLYAFFDSLGRRDAGAALGRLDRLFSGRPVRQGERVLDTEDYWPVRFLGMLADEVRRMLLIRSRLEEEGPGGGREVSMTYAAFQAKVLPKLMLALPPFGRSPFANAQGQVTGYLWYKVAQRAAPYRVRELARALGNAAEVDVKLKSSAPPLETLTGFVGRLIAGS